MLQVSGILSALKQGYPVEESRPGIYSIKGDILPIQIIDSRRLSAEENLWLRDLDNRLGAPLMRQVAQEITMLGKEVRIKAYLNAIARANKEVFAEVLKMDDIDVSLIEIFTELGLTAKWEARVEARAEARGLAEGEARGEEKKAGEIARNMLKSGFSEEQTAELSGLDIKKIRALAGEL